MKKKTKQKKKNKKKNAPSPTRYPQLRLAATENSSKNYQVRWVWIVFNWHQIYTHGSNVVKVQKNCSACRVFYFCKMVAGSYRVHIFI